MNDNIKILITKVEELHKLYEKWEKDNKIDDLKLQEYLYDILSWLEVCFKDMNDLSESERQLVSAFKYANNVKKHSQSIFNHSVKSYPLYPSKNTYPSNALFPSSFNIWWNVLPLDDNRYQNQYNNYNNCLKNKNILSTIDEITNVIKSHQ